MTLGKGVRKIESERKKNFKRRGQYVFLLQLVKHQNQERNYYTKTQEIQFVFKSMNLEEKWKI